MLLAPAADPIAPRVRRGAARPDIAQVGVPRSRWVFLVLEWGAGRVRVSRVWSLMRSRSCEAAPPPPPGARGGPRAGGDRPAPRSPTGRQGSWRPRQPRPGRAGLDRP